jgi:hypothetical protein
MLRLITNGVEQSVENTPKSWLELLTRLDDAAVQQGHMVTAVRFDGVDEPTFRTPEVGAKRLLAVHQIEIETANPAVVIDESLAQGGAAVRVLESAAERLSAQLRTGRVEPLLSEFDEFVEATRSVATILITAAIGFGVELTDIPWADRHAAVQLDELTALLISLLDAKQAQDWATAADILEFDVHPLLSTCVDVFDDLRATHPV